MEDPAYTAAAIDAATEAARREGDFAGWVALVLCSAAARLGSVAALTASRSGSWEAALVHQIVAGTVGEDGELLAAYAPGAAGG